MSSSRDSSENENVNYSCLKCSRMAEHNSSMMETICYTRWLASRHKTCENNNRKRS